MNEQINFTNKKIPESITAETLKALSYYPALKDTPIAFKFKKNIKKSTMQAQPIFGSFFRSRKNREYVILISKRVKIDKEVFKITDVPSDVLIGWIGHELGHVMDYKDRSVLSLLGFGIGYLILGRYIRAAERRADEFAVRHGLRAEILETKNFILNNAHLPEKYKNKIRRLYLSPEEVMEIVNTDGEKIPEKLAKI